METGLWRTGNYFAHSHFPDKDTDKKNQNRDVSQTQPKLASERDNKIRSLYTETNHWQLVCDLPHALYLLRHVRPDIVDIANGCKPS